MLYEVITDAYKRDSQQMTTIAPTAAHNPISWQRRLRNITYFPKRSQVKRFMSEVITPAMEMIVSELTKQGKEAFIETDKNDRVHFET